MTQSPFQTDVLQIDPSSGQTLLVRRNVVDNSLEFIDPIHPTGKKLSDLVSLKSITNMFIVGSGEGATHSTIQSALDDVPVTSSKSNPYLIIILSGIYSGSILIEKDGVYLKGWGSVFLTSGANATIDIMVGASSTPKYCVLEDLNIANTVNAKAGIKITGGAGSEVGSQGILVSNCNFGMTGLGGYQIDASAINNLSVVGGSWQESDPTSICRILQTASFYISDVRGANAFQLDYDNGGAIPLITTSSYIVKRCDVGNTVSTLTGNGSLSFKHSETGNVTCNGDRSVSVRSSKLGNLTLNNTVAAELQDSSRGTAAGTGTLKESVLYGSKVFAASTTESVAFVVAQPDTNYVVSMDYDATDSAKIINKTVSGFDIQFFSGPQTAVVSYIITRQV